MSDEEIEFELQFKEIDASIMAGFEKVEGRLNSRPEWWQISIGSKEATTKDYEAARVIYKQFLNFYKPDNGFYSGRSFTDILDLFTQAKLQNRL